MSEDKETATEGGKTEGGGGVKPIDGFGLILGMAVGWLLFDSFFWGMLFALLFGLAFAGGRRTFSR